ncbi:DUF3667 domain-containing protein [Pedobacter sp. Leaf194]|uniref:DUF3667 domain-containing protein n=1 Tax=Pedobacter sp. Leaf194 TaxID=1736297 RepID=UPI000702EFF6|nr:DUF3667 domain-containing protein [Pedobacter sp. Leaf194]KQS41317.1 hypothetical protein ASG14_02240 [Pedobacter sp. Leaf194]
MHKDNNHEVNTCPSCKTKFEGKFCHNCGEKAFHEKDYTIKKFIEQTVDIFTHFDGKFVRSIKYIFTKPGFLAQQNMQGIRVKYAKPMQIFLLANVLFFFITHIVGVTDYTPNIGDEKFGGISGYFIFKWLSPLDDWIVKQIGILTDAKLEHFGISVNEFTNRFWLNSYIYSKSFIVLLIPFSGTAIYLFFKKRFRYFSNALAFTAHFVSFQLIVFSIISIFRYRYGIDVFQPFTWLLYREEVRPITQFFTGSRFELIHMLYWIPYLFIAFKRVFPDESRLVIFIKTYFIARILFFITFVFYKKLLIVLTLLLMH